MKKLSHTTNSQHQNNTSSSRWLNYRIPLTGLILIKTLTGCGPNNGEEVVTPPSKQRANVKGIGSNSIITKSEMNSQTNNTNPYFGDHKPTLLQTFSQIQKESTMVSLYNDPDIVLSKGAGENEMQSRISLPENKRLKTANEHVYLHKKAKDILVGIQHDFSTALQNAGYNEGPIYLEITSGTRSHISQVYTAKTNANATDAMSAHEVGLAVDISLGVYRRKNKKGAKVKITDKNHIAKMNTILRTILKKHQNKDIFITPESTGIAHLVCLIYGPDYDKTAKPMDHSPHSVKAWKKYHSH